MYTCSKCGLGVIVTKDKGEIIKACKCTIPEETSIVVKYLFGLIKIKKKVTVYNPAPIVASATVKMKGVGETKSK